VDYTEQQKSNWQTITGQSELQKIGLRRGGAKMQLGTPKKAMQKNAKNAKKSNLHVISLLNRLTF
jgi:hypothetical protein